MKETVIRISDDGQVTVEEYKDGVKSYKAITPESLLECINQSVLRGMIFSGLLPKGCLSFVAHDNGEREICLIHPENRADISYYGTEYKDFPLPKLVFGFTLTKEGRVGSCRLGIVANVDTLKPDTLMYYYPFSNVSGYRLCTGNNVFPVCKSLHTCGSLPYYILSMPNNNDHFDSANNKRGLEMRDLLEAIKDKSPDFYYSDILIPNGDTLSNFIGGRRMNN